MRRADVGASQQQRPVFTLVRDRFGEQFTFKTNNRCQRDIMTDFKKLMVVAAAAACCNSPAQAAVSEQEAKQLESRLTAFGAEAAANKEGTIPAYSGGLTTPPANFVKGTTLRPDPFPGEKPLYSINASNMEKYGDKLTDGIKGMLKKTPSFRIDVYPSHRTVAYPQELLNNAVKNATRCKTAEEGLAIIEACRGGTPFPIPKTGHEVMWNHITRYVGNTEFRAKTNYVDASGRVIQTADFYGYQEMPYYNPSAADPKVMIYYRGDQLSARNAGNSTFFADHLNPVETGRRVYAYSPGQRRVRVAPDFAYDTPSDSSGGVQLYDEVNVFSGKMDRFDFKLIGKREVFMPYNNYKLYNGKLADILKPNNINPDMNRWELHRVWVVEATVKPGKRHVYSKRIFYIDEDLGGAMADNFDASGKLWRVVMSYVAPAYDVPASGSNVYAHMDLISGIYVYITHTGESGGIKFVPPKPSSFWTPAGLSAGAVR